MLRQLAVTGALIGAVLVSAAADAATVALDKPCYAEGAPVAFSGGGFAGAVSFSVAPATISGTPAAFSGSFAAPVQSDDRVGAVSTLALTATDDTGQTASASFQLVNFTVFAGTSIRSPKVKRTWEFAGFAVGLPIYGHFRRRGKRASDYRFGVAVGPCGRLTKRAAGLPKVKKLRAGRYDVQFDNSPTYSKTTTPAVISSVRVFRTYATR